MWCRAFEVNFGDVLFPKEELLNVASSGVATSSPLACTHKGEAHELGSQFYEDGACERSAEGIVGFGTLFEVKAEHSKSK